MKTTTLLIIGAVILVVFLLLRKPVAAATKAIGSTVQTQATINTAAGAFGSFIGNLGTSIFGSNSTPQSGSHTATASYGSSSFGTTSGDDVLPPSMLTDDDLLGDLG